MGRKVRMVPANWSHPRDVDGNYIPMFGQFPYNEAEIEEGLQEGWLNTDKPNYGLEVMPQWPTVERTHFQMYENITEGTPVSPVCSSAEELAMWLSENQANAGGGQTASYKEWLRLIQGDGWAPSFIYIGGQKLNGVSGLPLLGE